MASNTAYTLDAKQTLDSELKDKETRINLYTNQVKRLSPELKKQNIVHVVADGFYSKKKFVDGVKTQGLDLVGKVRQDVNAKWYFTGKYSGTGRPKRYDGKVKIDEDLSRFTRGKDLEDGVQVYYAPVYSVGLKRRILLVQLRWEQNSKVGRALLFSTDVKLDPIKIIEYYRARFQIEFIFRDAKQYTGLMDCQARCTAAIHTHINASLTALNVLKLEDRKQKQTEKETVISIASWKREKFNQHFMKILFARLDLNLNCQKVAEAYEKFRRYGAVAA